MKEWTRITVQLMPATAMQLRIDAKSVGATMASRVRKILEMYCNKELVEKKGE